jgi:hypothetical protein
MDAATDAHEGETMERERVHHDEAYRDDPELTTPEMTPGHGETKSPRVEAEGGAGAVGLGFGTAGVALAGEVERGELDEEQDVRTLGHEENHQAGVDAEP